MIERESHSNKFSYLDIWFFEISLKKYVIDRLSLEENFISQKDIYFQNYEREALGI